MNKRIFSFFALVFILVSVSCNFFTNRNYREEINFAATMPVATVEPTTIVSPTTVIATPTASLVGTPSLEDVLSEHQIKPDRPVPPVNGNYTWITKYSRTGEFSDGPFTDIEWVQGNAKAHSRHSITMFPIKESVVCGHFFTKNYDDWKYSFYCNYSGTFSMGGRWFVYGNGVLLSDTPYDVPPREDILKDAEVVCWIIFNKAKANYHCD